jgi:PAS domain S-box-containing protein
MHKLFGMAPGSFAGSYSDFLALIHADDREGLDATVKSVWSRREPAQRELRVITPAGITRDIATRGIVHCDESGVPLRVLGVCWVMTEYNRRSEDIRRSGERARVLIHATSAVVWTSDRNGEFHQDQPSWSAYTGQSRAQYQSLGWFEAFHPKDRERAFSEWQMAVHAGRSYEVEARIWNRETGAFHYCVTHAEPFLNPSGKIVEWAGTVVDVHDHRQVEQDLRALAGELKKSNQDLEEFAYIASHDLRAPLRAIANLAEWLEEDLTELVPPDNRRQLDLLRSRVGRLERLIDDLLKYSRAGRLITETELVDVRVLLEDVLSLQQLPPTFRAEISTDMPVIETVATPLRQIFLNLVGNAYKHHDRDSGVITISAADAGDFHEFAVADDGPGIPPDMTDRAFKVSKL